MDLDFLRTTTRAEHEGTEDTVPLMSATLTRAQYGSTLQRMYRAVRAWDNWAELHVPQRLRPLLQGRRRSRLIEADLACLGMELPMEAAANAGSWMPREPRDEGEREAMFLGAMYVMEGSTLGGQYIARHAEEVLRLAPGQGNAYFRGYGEETGSMWKSFKAVLAEVPDSYTDAVVQTAKGMFGFFAAQMADGAGESR